MTKKVFASLIKTTPTKIAITAEPTLPKPALEVRMSEALVNFRFVCEVEDLSTVKLAIISCTLFSISTASGDDEQGQEHMHVESYDDVDDRTAVMVRVLFECLVNVAEDNV